MRSSIVTAAFVAAALAGCATVPAPIAGKDFVALTPQQAAAQNTHGSRVRWGGEIIKVEPKASVTCFEILSRNLFDDARPNRREGSDGRFLACGNGFFDPEVYTKGRDLTITGQVVGTEQRLVGEHEYLYPRVDAEGIYLWPKLTRAPYYDPFWGPGYYDPFFGPYGGAYWWTPPVIIYHGSPPPSHH